MSTEHEQEPLPVSVTWPDGIVSEAECTECGRVRPHCIRRINQPGAPRLCEGCFAARMSASRNHGGVR